MPTTRAAAGAIALSLVLTTSSALAATVYLPGTSPACTSCNFGTHLPEGPTGSVAGAGGSGINAAAGTALDGARTYIYDLNGFVDGSVTRGDADFAMLVWDLGLGNALDTVRLYTHQDHYAGGPITTNFVGQDVMEYSVWGSNDNVTYSLLSDVVGFNLTGGGPGLPTYTFVGTEPTVVYRGGSAEFGTLNAYARDYTFPNAYRYFGIRASTLTGAFPCDGSTQICKDADPELDAVAFNRGQFTPVPEPGTMVLLASGLLGTLARRRRLSNR